MNYCIKDCPCLGFETPMLRSVGRGPTFKLKDAYFADKVLINNHALRIFPNPITFEINGRSKLGCSWAVFGPGREKFLNIIAGRYHANSVSARTYSDLNGTNLSNLIQFLEFRSPANAEPIHMSARYESLASLQDFGDSAANSVSSFVTGADNYNASSSPTNLVIDKILNMFFLSKLKNQWIRSLSNGQMRRARIARAVSTNPAFLIMNDPYLGLDPKSLAKVDESLKVLSNEGNMLVVVGLRETDLLPSWVTHIAYVDHNGLRLAKPRRTAMEDLQAHGIQLKELDVISLTSSLDDFQKVAHVPGDDSIIEFLNASVVYKGKAVLQNLSWKIARGSRWRILGENGSGKTTLLAMITAEHPQSWRGVLMENGKIRRPGSGITFFDINDRIGISSPELHGNVPFSVTVKEVIHNGLVSGIGNANFSYRYRGAPLNDFQRLVLAEFDNEIVNYGEQRFLLVPVTIQKLALFIRAVLKKPSILILDEAFSCMDDTQIIEKSFRILDEKLLETTIFVIGHADWELPRYEHILRLNGDQNRSYDLLTKSGDQE